MRTWDYEQIAKVRDEYIHSPKRRSLRELSEVFKIPLSTLENYSKRHNWVERRAKFQAEIESSFDRKALERAIGRRVRNLERNIRIAESTIDGFIYQLVGKKVVHCVCPHCGAEFDKTVKVPRVRISATDFERIARLQEYLESQLHPSLRSEDEVTIRKHPDNLSYRELVELRDKLSYVRYKELGSSKKRVAKG